MKKKITVLLIIVCLLTAFMPGCKSGGKEKLRVLLDQPNHSLYPEMEHEFKEILSKAVDEGIIDSVDDVEIEIMPNDGLNVEARNGEITRVRTEIFSGGGPDIFIIGTGTNIYDTPYENLFQYPNGVMAQKRFMELDEYIEGVQYMDWEAFNPVIMDAGKYEGSQYILPLSYTFPATVYNLAGEEGEKDYIGMLDKTTTWQDMLESEEPVIRHGAILFNSQSLNRVASVFGPTDDGHEALTFQKDELHDIFERALEQNAEQMPNLITSGEPKIEQADYGVPQNCRFDMGRGFDDPDFAFGCEDISGWDMDVLPLCSINGGVTATVTSYCAVNSNSSYKDTAFRLLDLLMCKDIQQHSKFSCIMGLNAFPVHEGLMSEGEPVYHFWRPDESWSVGENNYSAVNRAKELITEAKLFSNTEEYLTMGFAKCMLSPHRLEDIVNKTYSEMEMGLGES